MLETLEQLSISREGVHVDLMGVGLQTRCVPDSKVARSDSEILFVDRRAVKIGNVVKMPTAGLFRALRSADCAYRQDQP